MPVKSSKKVIKTSSRVSERNTKPVPKSLEVVRGGIHTANDFATLMGALMGDLIEGSVNAQVGNATCKAGANLLKVIEMQHKYGTAQPLTEKKTLVLVG